jgi:hypothetical protein
MVVGGARKRPSPMPVRFLVLRWWLMGGVHVWAVQVAIRYRWCTAFPNRQDRRKGDASSYR